MEEKNSGNKHLLNLEGEVCPINFVKIKLALEAMSEGDILEARVDGRYCGDVVKSIKEEGYKILYAKKQEDIYLIGIEK